MEDGVLDEIVLKCYMNICVYYNVNYKQIDEFLGENQAKIV